MSYLLLGEGIAVQIEKIQCFSMGGSEGNLFRVWFESRGDAYFDLEVNVPEGKSPDEVVKSLTAALLKRKDDECIVVTKEGDVCAYGSTPVPEKQEPPSVWECPVDRISLEYTPESVVEVELTKGSVILSLGTKTREVQLSIRSVHVAPERIAEELMEALAKATGVEQGDEDVAAEVDKRVDIDNLLQAANDVIAWYHRDGSVGGADVVIENLKAAVCLFEGSV